MQKVPLVTPLNSAVCILDSAFMGSPERLPRPRRLSAAQLHRILEGTQRRRLGHIDVYWMDNSAGYPRMGLIVPKFQSTGVARNRLRRRIKEIWRRDIQQIAGAADVVIRARASAYRADFVELRAQLVAWKPGRGEGQEEGSGPGEEGHR
jgi:ribonuclease P protein component